MLNLKNFIKCAVTSLLLINSSANASIITFFSPDAVIASNTSKPTGENVHENNLIDGSGLSSEVITIDNIDSVLHSNGVPDDIWRGSTSALPISLTFSFNEAQRIDYVGLWQGFQNREGTGDFSLTFFEGINGTGNVIGDNFYAELSDVNGARDSISLAGNAFDVDSRIGVRSMTMTITSVAVTGNPFVHLGEVMVATDIPEPSSVMLFLFGAVFIYAGSKRRVNR